MAIFDFMHTYYYVDFVKNDILKGELSVRFWILARLTEAVILLLFSYSPFAKKIDKRFRIIETIIIACGFFYILYMYPQVIPDLINNQGVTAVKVVLEYLVILIAALSLVKARRNLYNEHLINFKYLYVSILLLIPSEVCFILFTDSASFWMVFGQVLKVTRYYYLYKAVFQSLINYPYDRLNENNQRLSDILNAIPIPIQTYNRENKVDFINKKFEELFNCPSEKVMGLNDREFLQIIRKIDNESENTLLERLNNDEGDTRNIIRTYRGLDGKEIKVLFSGFKIKGGALFLANDVKHEQEIKNLNLQAQVILNAVTMATMILDYKGNIVACNNQFADIVEVDYREMIGMKIDKLNEMTNFSDKQLASVFSAGDFSDSISDCSIETPKGKKKHIQITTSVIRNVYNEKLGLLIVVQDKLKMREEQLKLVNQEKLALIGQMGATIVHETRNFLTTIKGNSQLIELFSDNEKIKSYARKINVDTDEVNRIISDFLNLSKPRETHLEEVAFNDLVASMKSTIETSSLMNNVQLVLELNYDERYIYCDETQIRQVILNICKNAVEAMDEAANPTLHISTDLDEYDKVVRIMISDNGRGIDSEIIKKIGTPFFTTKKTGTGLGLNACYQIIREHNGRIEIESEPGIGTTFTIAIPYIEEDLQYIV